MRERAFNDLNDGIR